MNANDKRRLARRILGTAFTGAGIAHFTHADFFANVVPAALADHKREINWATGVYQTAGGLTFFDPRLRQVARWSSIALLVPTFPEAFRQVREPERMKSLGLPPRLAAMRIVAQAAVLGVVWWSTQPDDQEV